MDDKTLSGGAAPNEGSAQVNPKHEREQTQEPNSGQNQNDTSKAIRPEDHKRAIDDLLKYKAEAQDLRKRLDSEEVTRLREKEDFKTLAEREKKRADEVEERLRKRDAFYNNETKLAAVKQAALKAGIRAEAESDLPLLSLEGVTVEVTNQGRFIVHGAEAYIEDLKRQKPHWFKTTKAPTVNSGSTSNSTPAGSFDPENLTPEKLLEAEKKLPREKFHELFRRYQQQRLKGRAS